jgi:hypothetical protein
MTEKLVPAVVRHPKFGAWIASGLKSEQSEDKINIFTCCVLV